MRNQITQLVVSLLLIAGILVIVFIFVFKAGNITHRQFWHILMGLFLLLLVILNLKPHWSVEKKHRRFFEEFLSETSGQLQQKLFNNPASADVEGAYQSFSKLIAGTFQGSVMANNSVQIITDGASKYNLLLRDLAAARESINMEYYHFGADQGSRDIRNMLIKKAQEGVRVKFINENVANFPIMHRYYTSMRKAGVQVIRFTGLRNFLRDCLTKLNYRNHRKIVVIDGKIGYTGGMNINDHYFRKWRDTHLRIEGDAVASLQLIFLNSWVISGGKRQMPYPFFFPEQDVHPENKLIQVISDEPGLNFHPIETSYTWALLHTKDYFYIQTPYFVPSQAVLTALKAAARSGADVRLMLPKKADSVFMGPANKSFFKECLSSGVRIYLRDGQFMHSKTFVCDDYLSCIGTANVDNRSFFLNYEDNAYIYDAELAAKNREIFEKDLELCQECTLEEVRGWHWYQRFPQWLMRFLAPLL